MSDIPPAMLYYVNDFMADPDVQNWDCEQVGAYQLLINTLWSLGGFWTKNSSNLKSVLRKKNIRSAERLWDSIKNKFQVSDESPPIVSHKRVLEELEKYRAKEVAMSERGRVAAKKRWHKHRLGDAISNAGSKGQGMQGASKKNAKSNQYILDASHPEPAPNLAPLQVAERQARERYTDWDSWAEEDRQDYLAVKMGSIPKRKDPPAGDDLPF